MNINCTNCQQPTIAKKWLILSSFLPFVFLFIQIKCGRCKQEQHYELGLSNIFEFLLSVVFQLGIAIVAIYAFVFTNANLWLMSLLFLSLYLIVCVIKIQLLLKIYDN